MRALNSGAVDVIPFTRRDIRIYPVFRVHVNVHLQEVDVVHVQPLKGLVHSLYYVFLSHPRPFSAISNVRQVVTPPGDLHNARNTQMGEGGCPRRARHISLVKIKSSKNAQ